MARDCRKSVKIALTSWSNESTFDSKRKYRGTANHKVYTAKLHYELNQRQVFMDKMRQKIAMMMQHQKLESIVSQYCLRLIWKFIAQNLILCCRKNKENLILWQELMLARKQQFDKESITLVVHAGENSSRGSKDLWWQGHFWEKQHHNSIWPAGFWQEMEMPLLYISNVTKSQNFTTITQICNIFWHVNFLSN